MLKQASFREEILEEDKQEGIQQGRTEERKNIVKIMLSNGMTVEQIAKAISMSEDVVKSYIR